MTSPEPKPEFDTVDYENGNYYEGEVVNRVPHGHGIMIYADKRGEVECDWEYGLPILPARVDTKIPYYDDEKYQKLAVVNKCSFCVGHTYDSGSIADTFEISSFVRGIRIHHDKAVLFSLENSVYQDGKGWQKDNDGEYVFVYTGEGLTGNQVMSRGNLFLKNSSNGRLYLFVKRKEAEYVFYGIVDVKRVETAIEPDKHGNNREVFKFILRRHSVE